MDRDTVAAFAELRDRQGLPLRSHYFIDSGARTGEDLQTFIAELNAIRAAYAMHQDDVTGSLDPANWPT